MQPVSWLAGCGGGWHAAALTQCLACSLYLTDAGLCALLHCCCSRVQLRMLTGPLLFLNPRPRA